MVLGGVQESCGEPTRGPQHRLNASLCVPTSRKLPGTKDLPIGPKATTPRALQKVRGEMELKDQTNWVQMLFK